MQLEDCDTTADIEDHPAGRCQTNSNQSQFTAECLNLRRAKLSPLGKSGGTVELEIVACVEVAFVVEVVVN